MRFMLLSPTTWILPFQGITVNISKYNLLQETWGQRNIRPAAARSGFRIILEESFIQMGMGILL